MKRSTLAESGGQKSRSQKAEVRFGGLAEASFPFRLLGTNVCWWHLSMSLHHHILVSCRDTVTITSGVAQEL